MKSQVTVAARRSGRPRGAATPYAAPQAARVLSLTMFAVAVLAGRRAARRRPAGLIRAGFAILTIGLILLIPVVPRADSGWWLVVPLVIAGIGLGLLVSQLNNYTLSPDLG